MIVVCGDLAGGATRGVSAAAVAGRAAGAGSAVQLVGLVRDDREGDRQLLELAAAGVGHAAVLRGTPRDLEPADVDLALRYLPDVRVIVAVRLAPPVLAAAAERASWSAASLVAIDGARSAGPHGQAVAPVLPEGAVVLEAPPADPDGTFAGFVGTFVARLDAGANPADAWAATMRDLAVDPV